MRQLRSLGQYTGIRYTMEMGLADGVCAEEVRDVLLAFTKSNREVVPTTNPKEEHKKSVGVIIAFLRCFPSICCSLL